MTTPGDSLDQRGVPADGPTEPFTHPAPALPAITNPDSTYTTMPGTNDQLVHHGALRMAVRPALFWLAILLPVYVAPLVLIRVPAVVIALVVVALTAWLSVSTYLKLRKVLRSAIDDAMPAPTQSLRLGSDALDLADRTSHSRIDHDRITSITVNREVVTLRFDGMGLAMPRALWPDPVVARLRDLIDPRRTPAPSDPPPQPPMPRPAEPHTTVVAGPDTAVRLAVAQRREPWLSRIVLIAVAAIAVLAVGFAFFGGRLYGPLGVTFPLAFGALALASCWHLANRPPAKVVRHHECAAYPGATLSAHFGTDAVLLATPAWVMRMPYAMIGKITFRADVAALTYGLVPIALPSALFPPPITAGLRERGLTVVER
ncbi:hypothetical protein [Nocardia sp. NPDC060259]|uniref:hypothetical protein n=1 Tax=Nocardia sp. NPDC060259 TaxID=3347088 RepID=UPI0036594DE8